MVVDDLTELRFQIAAFHRTLYMVFTIVVLETRLCLEAPPFGRTANLPHIAMEAVWSVRADAIDTLVFGAADVVVAFPIGMASTSCGIISDRISRKVAPPDTIVCLASTPNDENGRED